MNKQKLDLAVIIPTYNEEGSIEKVINKWTNELLKTSINFKINVYNDGSTDKTLEILNQLKENNKNLIIYNKINSGHGSTILQGYCENTQAEWIFQADSDDEIEPKSFHKLWSYRDKYEFMIGRRCGRKSPLSRSIVSFFARLIVNIFYGKSVYDVNCPYRLMKVDIFKDCFFSIPKSFFAPNIIITGYAALKNVRDIEIDVFFKPRITGETSIKKLKLFKVAVISCWQTIFYRIFLIP
jgi:glycosyltransferase involved in cell wall biosynthesis